MNTLALHFCYKRRKIGNSVSLVLLTSFFLDKLIANQKHQIGKNIHYFERQTSMRVTTVR